MGDSVVAPVGSSDAVEMENAPPNVVPPPAVLGDAPPSPGQSPAVPDVPDDPFVSPYAAGSLIPEKPTPEGPEDGVSAMSVPEVQGQMRPSGLIKQVFADEVVDKKDTDHAE